MANNDRISEVYRGDLFSERAQRAARSRIHWMCSQVRGKRVLDIGCSQGITSILVGREGFSVVGVDIEEPAIDFARAELAAEPDAVRERVQFVCDDIFRADLGGERFDTVILGEVLEHQTNPRQLFVRACELLQPSGVIIAATPFGLSVHHDHKSTLYLGDFMATIADLCKPANLDIFDGYIRFIGHHLESPEPASPLECAAVLALSEAAFLDLQWRNHDALKDASRRIAHAGQRTEAGQTRIARLERRIAEQQQELGRLRASEARAANPGTRDSSRSVGARPGDHAAAGGGAAASTPPSGSAVARGMATLRQSIQREVSTGRLRSDPITAARKTYARVRRAVRNDPASDDRPPDDRLLDDQVYAGAYRIDPPAASSVEPSSDKRVLHLLEYSMPHKQNGYTLRAREIIRAQKLHGWDPVVVTRPRFPRAGSSDIETVAGAPHYRLPGRGLGDKPRLHQHLTAYVTEAAAVIEATRPMLIHAASNFRNAYAAMELARAYRLPWVYEVRGLWEETRRANLGLGVDDPHYQRLLAVETCCMRQADAIVTLGAELAGEIQRRGVQADKIFLVPNGIDPDAITPLPLERRDGPSTRPDGTARFTVGYIGSVTRLERLDVLVDAMVELGHRDDIAALVVGDGTEREALEKRARDRGVADRIRFAGRVPHAEVAASYAAVNAIVCTRGRDRVSELVTPLKPLETMGYRLPMIVSDLPALRETVRDGETGRLVPPEDPAALARVIAELADDPAQCEDLASRAHEWVTTERTWVTTTAGYQAAYERAREAFQRRQKPA